jgi:hypothetical protein
MLDIFSTMMIILKVLTKYVPEVSVIHIARTLCRNIRFKKRLGGVYSVIIKLKITSFEL